LTALIPAEDILITDTYPITVINPAPGGGTSAQVGLAVNNPVPTLSSLSPDNRLAGATGFTLTVNGANFVPGAVISWNGVDRLPTTFFNSTKVTAQIPAADLLNAGTASVTVTNPAPGGGAALAPLTFTINNPVPTISAINPATAIPNSPAFELTVDGTNFNGNSRVHLDGVERVTTFVSATQIKAAILAEDLVVAGSKAITVVNPAPGGGTTTAINLVVNNPLPTTSTLAPSTATAGDVGFNLIVTGTNFVSGAVINFGGTDYTTTLVDATHVSADIPASAITVANTYPVVVTNPAPGGGSSTPALMFTVNNPGPSVTGLSPATKTAGEPDFELTVTGTNFNSSSIVRFNGGNRTTILDSSTQLRAQITAADILSAGSPAITVFNPAPGGGLSNASPLTVNNPAPALTSISPVSKTVGDAPFQLTVDGSNFNASSRVLLDGTERVTTLVSATQVTAAITATDLASAHVFQVTVVNPAPGGGTSTSTTFTVNNALPTISTISPTSATAGDTAFLLGINGTNFVTGTTVNFGGVNYIPTILTSTQMTVQINAAEIATAGIKAVTVTNPTPGGGTSTPINFTVNNPLPTTISLNPASAIAGDPLFVLEVTGTNFVPGSVIKFGITNYTTTFVDSTHVTAEIPATEIVNAGSIPVSVTNPTPGGGVSVPDLTFTVSNPVPAISTISPPSITASNPEFTLTVTGTGFNLSSIVQFNGLNRVTTYVSATQLTAQILATDITAVGFFPITVFNPAPGGATSTPVNLQVTSVPVPAITSLSTTSIPAGGLDTPLTVNGSNFVGGSVVHFNGLPRATTFVSATQLTVTLLAADLTASGNFPITVVNPAPGGGTSTAVNLTISPNIVTLSPASVRAGDVGFTLTVNGAGFVVGSVVRFNGVAKSTTFISSTQVAASIAAADISTVGTYPITVLTPAPTSLTSNAVNLSAIPSILNLTPLSAVVGTGSFTLTVNGAGFVNGSVIQWNGVNKTTTFVNSTRLTCSISSTDINTMGPRIVAVLNPLPNNLTSNPITFQVTSVPPATECAVGADVNAANPGLINSGPARAQLWRTDDGMWWGAFSDNLGGIYFYKRSTPTTWNKGALIDTFSVAGTFVAGSPDALWTGTNLFIMIQETVSLARLYKYTYNSTNQTYAVVAGFPIDIPLVGVGTNDTGKIYGTLAIQQDTTGKLWAAYAGAGVGGDGNVRAIYSTSANHTTWDTNGVIIASGLSTLDREGTTIVSFAGKIGVAWSNSLGSEDAFRFRTDGDPEATWSPKEVIDSGLGPEGTGSVAGKQMSMKAHPDGRIFFVGDDNDGVNGHLHLYIRTAAGVWGNKTLVVNSFSAMPSKGLLLLDIENNTVHVLYKDGQVTTNGLTGQTFITQASMTNPAFNSPCLILDTSDDGTGLTTSNPTSTKQNLNATSDLVVAGSTGRGGNRIISNLVDLTPNALTIFAISPAAVTAGEASFTLTITGKLFQSNSTVRLNGSTTGISNVQFVNSGKITATVASSRITSAATLPVTVRNSNPTVDSNPKNLVVTATHPVPTLGLISPNRQVLGSPQFTMTLHGTGFRRSSVVRLNGVNKTTQFVSDTTLTATIPASDMTTAGARSVVVFNPTPGGGTSTPTAVTTFYVQPACTSPSGQNIPGITLFNTVKSQMWYNDSLWWGAFSDNVGGLYFYKQSATSYTKGALIDSNFNGRPDVLWNGTNLFVLVYEFNTLAKLYKYTYNTTTDTYALISGFPVNLTLTGIGAGVSAAETGSITLAQDSTGKLWASYPGSFIGGDGNYRVIWSTSADHKTWNATGHIFDTGGSVDTQEVAPIVHFAGNKIGIVYSKQPTKEVLFLYHNDGDPETTWGTKEIVDSGLGHLGIGGVADNHMSLRAAPDGRLFLVAKDSDGAGFINL
jgi:hypothetical protein